MQPLYVAPWALVKGLNDAEETQAGMTQTVSYLSGASSHSFGAGCSQVTDPQNTWGIRFLSGILRVDKINRRLICLRASRAFARFPCWSSWQHVATMIQVTSSWSLSHQQQQQQLRQSLLSTASFKFVELILGQAYAPVPYHHQPYQSLFMEAA